MKQTLALLFLLLFKFTLNGEEAILPRHPAPSPDGSEIAFSWQGDIWTVSSNGGEAKRLTIHPAYDHSPKWSPDGYQIGFVSDRWGNDDIYITSKEGGKPERLTYWSGSDLISGFSHDGKNIIFSSMRYETNYRNYEMYKINLETKETPVRFTEYLGFQPTYSPDGKTLAYMRGSESTRRKGYRGSGDADVWIKEEGKNAKLMTKFEGADHSPMWSPDGKTIWYISEKDGTYNLYSMNLKGKTKQHTNFEKDGPRNASISYDGTLITMEIGGGIVLFETGPEKLKELKIDVTGDSLSNDFEWKTVTSGASSFSISPSDSDALLIVLDGDIWLQDLEKEESHRVTFTAEQEIYVQWINNGEKILFTSNSCSEDSEKEICNTEQIWIAEPSEEKEKTREVEEWKAYPITNNSNPTHHPKISPNGEKIAFVRDYGKLIVADFDPNSENKDEIITNEIELRDGWDWPFISWSPDSEWISWSVEDIEHNSDVWISKADGSTEPKNISSHPDMDLYPTWSENGRVLAFSSTRTSFTPRGSSTYSDIWYVFLRENDEELSQEEREELWEKEEEERDEDSKWVDIDLEDIEFRLRRATSFDGSETEVLLNKEGSRIVFKGTHDGSDLYSISMNDFGFFGSATKVTSGHSPSKIRWGHDEKKIYYLKSGGTVYSTSPTKNSVSQKSFRARYKLDRVQQRKVVFEEAWATMYRGFYDPNLHGANWKDIHERYLPWAVNAAHPRDFDYIIDSMLGELNGSHLGYYGRIPSLDESKEYTGSLGVLFDWQYKGEGLMIKSIIENTPADKHNVDLQKGDIVTKINKVNLNGENMHNLLVDTSSNQIPLTIERKTEDQLIKNEVWFSNIKDGDKVSSPLFVGFGVSGFEIEMAGLKTEKKGHFHLIVNDAPSKKGSIIPADETHIHYMMGEKYGYIELEPGEHTLTIQLADGLHEIIDDNLYKTITIEVVEKEETLPKVFFTYPKNGSVFKGAFEVSFSTVLDLPLNVPIDPMKNSHNHNEHNNHSHHGMQMDNENTEMVCSMCGGKGCEHCDEHMNHGNMSDEGIHDGHNHEHGTKEKIQFDHGVDPMDVYLSLIINGENIEKGEIVPHDINHLHFGKEVETTILDLDPGKHTLILQATNSNQESLGPDFASTIEIEVLGEVEEKIIEIEPVSSYSIRSALYEEWVKKNREKTEEDSDGKLGYVHIQGMSQPSLERFEAELYSVGHGKEGLVIDVRDNGGGWTTDMLLQILMVERHAYTVPRGASEGNFGYPQNRLSMYSWTKPIIVLCNQNSYSNAEIFSHAIKTLDRGKLVGVPTRGAVISTGSKGLIDGSSMRYPFRGWFVADGNKLGKNQENGPAIPDIIIEITPEDEISGNDPQLDSAIKSLLKDLR